MNSFTRARTNVSYYTGKVVKCSLFVLQNLSLGTLNGQFMETKIIIKYMHVFDLASIVTKMNVVEKL